MSALLHELCHVSERPRRQSREPWDRLPKHIRELARNGVRSRRYQVRIYWGDCKKGRYSFNYGTYPSVHVARKVRDAALRLLREGWTLCDTLVELRSRGVIPAHIRSMWARPCPGGWRAEFSQRGRFVQLDGPYATDAEATMAMSRHLGWRDRWVRDERVRQR